MSGAAGERLVVAWGIMGAVVVWSCLWKCIAFWKAARRDQVGWYVVIALAPPFGLLEMIYVFLVAPKTPESGETPF